MPMSSPDLEESPGRSDEFSARLIESSRDCIEILDLDGRLLSMNAHGMAAMEIRDFGPLAGSLWIDLWEGDDRARANAAIEAARRGDVGRFTGFFAITQTKTPKWWDVSVSAILDKDGEPEKLLAVSRDVTEFKQVEQALRRSHEDLEKQIRARRRDLTHTSSVLQEIVEGVDAKVGEQFFPSLVQQLATALAVDYAYISERNEDGTRFRSKAGWGKGRLLPPFEVPAHGPCETVLTRKVVHHPDGLRTLYPHVRLIQDTGVESYCGVPVMDSSGRVAGHLAIMDSKPMPDPLRPTSILGIFANRAAAEFERLRFDRAKRKNDLTLRAITEGTATEVGGEFFQSLVKNLAKALDVTYSFMSEFCVDRTKVRTLAFWAGDRFKDNFEYLIEGTPCEKVLAGELYHCPDKVADQFPLHREDLKNLGVESYLAIPVASANGQILGHLAVMDTKPMEVEELDLSVFKIFGARAGAELERTHIEARLKDSEERLRDLFDEAPIAYVHEGLDTRFIRANRAALKSLGITQEEVNGTYGKNFIPDTPEAQRRLKEALASIGRGTDTGGVVLELRRKDDGKPLWIQWWSRPDSSGAYTRTMFLDITEKVLMEQEKARLEAANVYLQEEIKTAHNFEEIIGTSTAVKKVLQAVEQVAATDATVLITGETGTGKELIARAIHNLSTRKHGVLVKVNCAAIPAGLIESELFGHEKGAFTGALARKIGRFELADNATIFLDEVGEIPLELQTKLLRVLQEGEFERLGSGKTLKVNVRVIAATNRDLDKEVREGRFRSDLFYRLKVFPIRLPALRERKQDIPLLVSYFVKKYSGTMGKKVGSLSASTIEMLKHYPWPGNIRELEHVIERAVILSQGPRLDLGDWMPKSGRGIGCRTVGHARRSRTSSHSLRAEFHQLAGQRRKGCRQNSRPQPHDAGSAHEKAGHPKTVTRETLGTLAVISFSHFPSSFSLPAISH
jgi:formate hydrogenlyase transcriptional activator